jgi:ankyrin repeat protein
MDLRAHDRKLEEVHRCKWGFDLYQAVRCGHPEECHRLLAQDISYVNVRDEAQGTPLHLAAAKGLVDVCRVLIEAGAMINLSDSRQFTLLAALAGHVEVCRILMEAGAAVDASKYNQYTCLHIAACNGHVKVCRMLIEARAAVDARNHNQYTPLHSAAQEEHVKVCCMLMAAGATVEAGITSRPRPSTSLQSVGALRSVVFSSRQEQRSMQGLSTR